MHHVYSSPSLRIKTSKSLPFYLQCMEALDYHNTSNGSICTNQQQHGPNRATTRACITRNGGRYAGVEFDDQDVEVPGHARNISLQRTIVYDCQFYFTTDLSYFLRQTRGRLRTPDQGHAPAGATAGRKLTFKPDHQPGADQTAPITRSIGAHRHLSGDLRGGAVRKYPHNIAGERYRAAACTSLRWRAPIARTVGPFRRAPLHDS